MRATLEIVTKLPAAANDMMMMGMLLGYKGSLTVHGKLLRYGKLVVISTDDLTKIGPERLTKEAIATNDAINMVFLFEQIVILSKVIVFEGTDRAFTFKKQMKTNRISLIPNLPTGGGVREGEEEEEGDGKEAKIEGNGEEEKEEEEAEKEGEALPAEEESEWKLENALGLWDAAEGDSSTAFTAIVFPNHEMKQEWIGSMRDILRMQQQMVSMLQNPRVDGFADE